MDTHTAKQSLEAMFSPCTLGEIAVRNRIAMAPMTRARAPSRVPDDLLVDYYSQRAGAGLIISEATQISLQGTGCIATPGIHSAEQIAGWRRVTDAVHERGGRMICQLWHVGRVSHASMLPQGGVPVSSSAVSGQVNTFTADGYEPCTPPRALLLDEIPKVIEEYRQAALNAMAAGFDGVQVHAASGYLLDQFLRDGVNQRDDQYGGSVQNRARLLLEVTDAVCDAIGAARTAVRLSPFTVTWDCDDSDPASVFTYAVEALNSRDLAFLELVERGFDSIAVSGAEQERADGFTPARLRKHYSGTLMVNGCYDASSAAAIITSGFAQMVSIGRPYISTPDVVERWREGVALNPDVDAADWYGGGAQGYSDQPAMDSAGGHGRK